MTNSEVMHTYSLPALDEILQSDFRNRFGLNRAGQYGVACREPARELARAEALGAGPFFPAKIAAPNWIENGKRQPCRLDIALGYVGDAQLEFLGPGKGTSFYQEALQGRESVLHHVGVFQNNSKELERRLNAVGFATVVDGGVSRGRSLGFRFKYFDTRVAIGCYLEILDFYLFGRPLSIEQPVKRLAGLRKRIRR